MKYATFRKSRQRKWTGSGYGTRIRLHKLPVSHDLRPSSAESLLIHLSPLEQSQFAVASYKQKGAMLGNKKIISFERNLSYAKAPF